MKKKLLSIMLGATVAISLTACGGSKVSEPDKTSDTNTTVESDGKGEDESGPVTIKVFSNQTDRKTG